MKADLHVHTTASDGRFSPAELVAKAAGQGMEVMAITDHDSVEGVAPALEAVRAFPSLKVIPGVEIGTDVPDGEVHVLGYFINYLDDALVDKLADLRDSRKTRAKKMIAKLGHLGVHIEWERVEEIAGSGSVGRPHVAQAIMEKGYVQSLKEAFARYIGRDGPAYAEREKMTPQQVVELVVRVGGLPVLAHPADIEDLEEVIPRLQRAGLAGMEVYYNAYASVTIQHLASLARKHHLIATGGSDFHGLEHLTETPMGGVDIPPECIERLLAFGRRQTPSSSR
ncbi:MAG: PHP domain-containing protein [Chloroflexi bacterium]|nr:PHP domain-containing protein [Chloroflexota bacterium]